MAEGVCGPLESTIPAITVPAWLSMVTGHDPGELGLYGFHNRRDHGYGRLALADSTAITAATVWDLLSGVGRKVVLVGVPPSYSPKPVNGALVSCCLTPDTTRPGRPLRLVDCAAMILRHFDMPAPAHLRRARTGRRP